MCSYVSKLVHIKCIETTSASKLNALNVFDGNKTCLKVECDWKVLPIKELADVKVEDSLENGQRFYTTTVSFYSPDRDVTKSQRSAFRLTSVKGKRYLIGSNDRPYPIIKEVANFPEDPKNTSMKRVVITWKSIFPLLELVD